MHGRRGGCGVAAHRKGAAVCEAEKSRPPVSRGGRLPQKPTVSDRKALVGRLLARPSLVGKKKHHGPRVRVGLWLGVGVGLCLRLGPSLDTVVLLTQG